jgi:hypothetical protein
VKVGAVTAGAVGADRGTLTGGAGRVGGAVDWIAGGCGARAVCGCGAGTGVSGARPRGGRGTVVAGRVTRGVVVGGADVAGTVVVGVLDVGAVAGNGAAAGGPDGVPGPEGGGVTGRNGSVGAGVPRATVCTTLGDGLDGVIRKITADSPRKPTAIAPAPYASILPIGVPPARACDPG